MELDLLSAIDMTASAAIAILVLAIGFGKTTGARVRIATGLVVWFIVVIIVASTRILHDNRGIGTPGLGVAVILPIVILSIYVLRSPALFRALQTIPLSMLVGVNVIRTFGLVFVLLYAADRLPAPFAPVAGWGDILVGVTAVPVAWLVYKKGAAARSTVFIWNTVGLVDLIVAVGLGMISSPGPLQLIHNEPGSGIMTTLPWLIIPGFLVPLLAVTHLAVFYRLSKTESLAREGTGA